LPAPAIPMVIITTGFWGELDEFDGIGSIMMSRCRKAEILRLGGTR